MQVPRVEKITLNMGVGEAKQDSNMLEAAQEQLATIAGQQPNVRRARKSIAAFKLRDGMPVGVQRHAAPRAHVRVPRPADVDRDPAHPRLPRPQRALVRRPRQLLDGRPRADHLPRDRLRRDRPGARPRRDDHHDAPRPTRRPTRSCESSGMPFSREGAPGRGRDGRGRGGGGGAQGGGAAARRGRAGRLRGAQGGEPGGVRQARAARGGRRGRSAKKAPARESDEE